MSGFGTEKYSAMGWSPSMVARAGHTLVTGGDKRLRAILRERIAREVCAQDSTCGAVILSDKQDWWGQLSTAAKLQGQPNRVDYCSIDMWDGRVIGSVARGGRIVLVATDGTRGGMNSASNIRKAFVHAGFDKVHPARFSIVLDDSKMMLDLGDTPETDLSLVTNGDPTRARLILLAPSVEAVHESATGYGHGLVDCFLQRFQLQFHFAQNFSPWATRLFDQVGVPTELMTELILPPLNGGLAIDLPRRRSNIVRCPETKCLEVASA